MIRRIFLLHKTRELETKTSNLIECDVEETVRQERLCSAIYSGAAVFETLPRVRLTKIEYAPVTWKYTRQPNKKVDAG